MGTYTSIINPGLVNAEGEHKYLNRLFSPGVATGLSSTSFQVVQRGAGANMSVDVSVGDGNFQLPTNAYSIWGWTDAATNVVVSAANTSNPRVDVAVAWIDTTVTTTSTANNPGSLKFSIIAGTPSASPTAVSDTAIQSTLGASIAWIKLAYIYVGTSVSSITTSVITDARTAIQSRFVASNSNSYNPVKFSYTLTGTYTDSGAASKVVIFNTKEYDTSNSYNTSTGLFTAPVSGYYHFAGSGSWVSMPTGGEMIAAIQKNGSVLRQSSRINNNINAGTMYAGIATDVQLTAGDTVAFSIYHSGTSSNESGTTQNYFNGHLVSTT